MRFHFVQTLLFLEAPALARRYPPRPGWPSNLVFLPSTFHLTVCAVLRLSLYRSSSRNQRTTQEESLPILQQLVSPSRLSLTIGSNGHHIQGGIGIKTRLAASKAFCLEARS